MERGVKILIFILLVADLGYTAYLNFHVKFDGDLASIVMPIEGDGYYDVLQDPLAFSALIDGEIYSNPNRYFSHAALSIWFQCVPIGLQVWMSPIDSLYFASTLFKTSLQFFLIFLLATIISNTKNILSSRFLVAALLITPLFQTFGLNRHMGIIDMSITYCFFYAFPLTVLLVFLMPFLRNAIHGEEIRFPLWQKVIWLTLIPIICLSGAIIPGVILVLTSILFLANFNRVITFDLPVFQFLLAGLFLLFASYSLYIGTFNYEGQDQVSASILEKYGLLWTGFVKKFTTKIGFPLLFIMIGIGAYVIKNRYKGLKQVRINNFVKWGFLFSLLFIFLLPFGGSRSYRVHFIRYDTIMPVTLFVFLAYGIISHYLIFILKGRFKFFFLGLIACYLLIFTLPDKLQGEEYFCERAGLEEISNSVEGVLEIQADCPVFTWEKVHDPSSTKSVARLLYYWNVTNKPCLYFNKID